MNAKRLMIKRVNNRGKMDDRTLNQAQLSYFSRGHGRVRNGEQK